MSISPAPMLAPRDADAWVVDGDLAIRDETRRVMLDLELGGVALDPWGGLRAGFRATTEINHEEFGMSWNQAIETGGFLMGKTANIELEIEAVRLEHA